MKKSINIAPNKNGEKYMMLGQLTENPREVFKCYQSGVEIFIHDYNTLSNTLNNNLTQKSPKDLEKLSHLRSSIASGYAAIAELHMTSILWYNNNLF